MSDDATLPPRRRDDTRMDRLETRMGAFEGLLAENTAVTTEIKNIAITLRTIGKFSVWAGGIVFAVASAWAAVSALSGGVHP